MLVDDQVIETLYDLDIFEHIQLWSQDEQHRLFLNDAAGLYSSPVDRYNLSNNTSDWYVPLKCFVNQTHISILSLGHQLTLNIYLNPLSSLLYTDGISGGTLTSSSCTINSCNAICRITRMTQKVVDDTIMMLTKMPTTYLFSDIKYQSFLAQSGITTFTGVLSNITGKLQALYFVVRPTTGLTGDNAFSFTEISQFEIRNGGSQNIIGGSPVKSDDKGLR